MIKNLFFSLVVIQINEKQEKGFEKFSTFFVAAGGRGRFITYYIGIKAQHYCLAI